MGCVGHDLIDFFCGPGGHGAGRAIPGECRRCGKPLAPGICLVCSRPGIALLTGVSRFSLHGPQGERVDGPLCEHCYAELRTGTSPTGWAAIHARLARGA